MKSSMYGTLTLAAFALAACSGNPLADEQKGANVILSAVRAVCTPVTGSDVPAQYSGSLYDCAGAAEALHAYN